MSSYDIRSILDRLNLVEGKVTPATVKHGLNAQQKSVPQLPALFKPHGIRVLGSPTDPRHPMTGYQVGADESVESNKSALGEAMQAVEEDMLSKVKRDLTNYLDRLEKKVAVSRDLTDKAKDAVERHEVEEQDVPADSETGHDMAYAAQSDFDAAQKPIQSVAMEDGTMCEVHEHGDEYEVRVGGRSIPTRFSSSADAGMAIDLFRARRAARHKPQQEPDADYIEER